MGSPVPAQTAWWGQEIHKQETTALPGGTWGHIGAVMSWGGEKKLKEGFWKAVTPKLRPGQVK